MPSWVRGEEEGLKSPLWDPARGVLLAERQKGSWRHLWHLAGREPNPGGGPHSPWAFKVLPYSLALCRLTSVTAAWLSPNCIPPPPRNLYPCFPLPALSGIPLPQQQLFSLLCL